MPCDIGYRSVAKASVVTQAPELDATLMERLGVEDPPLVAWLFALDTEPILTQALERMLEASRLPGEFRITNGALVSRTDSPEIGALAAKRWQVEVFRVVLELLDYATEVSERGALILVEAEKHGPGGVHEYVAITTSKAGDAEVRFEHFSSEAALAAEQGRFLALAQKLGVAVRLTGETRAGQPIPKGTVHPHKSKGKAR